MSRILIIEDNPDQARLIERALEKSNGGYLPSIADTAAGGLRALQNREVDLVLLDYSLPEMNGLEVLKQIRKQEKEMPVIIVTGAGSEEIAVEAMKLGADDYIVKHGNYLLTLPLVVTEVLERYRLEKRNRELQSRLRSKEREVRYLKKQLERTYGFDSIIGESEPMRNVIGQIEKAIFSSASILLEGETGTGKELFARAIHFNGPRKHKALAAQNCAAIPETLLESELFGYVRGAFTGAERDRKGLFQEANGGTVFLDEISETTGSFQSKLLRVLQEREIRPIGSNETKKIDVRIIAATNRDLQQEVNDGRFRKDLFYRLSVFPIRIPPLREHREDILALMNHFLRTFNEKEGKTARGLEPEALRQMQNYDWPGNIRELENEIHRLVVLSEGENLIPASLLSDRIRGRDTRRGLPSNREGPLSEILSRIEQIVIEERLDAHGNNRTETAKSLGVTRETLYKKMKRLSLLGQGRKEPDKGGS